MIEPGTESFHVRDVEPLVVGDHRARKPSGGNETGDDTVGARPASERHDGDGVVSAIGDVESPSILAQRERIRLAAKWQRGIRTDRHGLRNAQRFRVDHADRVGVGIGHKQGPSIRAQRQTRWMKAGGDFADFAILFQVDDRNGPG